MRKLTLDSLHVDSFETTAAAPHLRGTVQAHAEAEPITGRTCEMYETCQVSCDPAACQGTEDWMCCTYGCTRLYETCGVEYCWVDDATKNCTS